MLRLVPPLIAAVLLVGTGIVHGFWTDRWAPAVEPRIAADRLGTIPMTIGDWDGKIPDKPGESVPGVVGSVQCLYTNRVTGQVVTVAMVCGRPGPVAIHTPESCYTASGYDLGPRSAVNVEPGIDFWTADAVRVKATEEGTATPHLLGLERRPGLVGSARRRPHHFRPLPGLAQAVCSSGVEQPVRGRSRMIPD